MIRAPLDRAPLLAAQSAVSCGMPTPATIRVVQIEPGPWPILMALAPQSARYSAPSALVTLPAMIVRVGKALRSSFTMSPTPRLCPWAVETAMASMASSTKAPT